MPDDLGREPVTIVGDALHPPTLLHKSRVAVCLRDNALRESTLLAPCLPALHELPPISAVLAAHLLDCLPRKGATFRCRPLIVRFGFARLLSWQ